MNEPKKPPTADEVKAAIGVIADYCERLPDDYKIELSFWNDECGLDIYDDNGEELTKTFSDMSRVENWPIKEDAPHEP